MRTSGRTIGVAVVGLAILASCDSRGEDEGCVLVDMGGNVYCPVTCVSWVNLVVSHLPWHTSGRFQLQPDYSVSPPQAEVKVGERFQANVAHPDLQPAGCNEGFDGPYTFRSTDEAVVVALNGEGVSGVLGAIYEAIGPGSVHVIVDMPTPSGHSEAVPLTVCAEPDQDQVACSSRVLLVVRVVP